MGGVLVAVKRGWLTFHCGEGEAERLDKRKGYPGGFAIGSATCIPVTAYTKRPSWEIYSASGPLGSLSLPYDFCLISGLVPGCTITVTFSVYIKDLDDEEMPEEPEVPDSEDGEAAERAAIPLSGPVFPRLAPLSRKS